MPKTVGCVVSSVDSDQTPRSAATDLSLHCLGPSDGINTWVIYIAIPQLRPFKFKTAPLLKVAFASIK